MENGSYILPGPMYSQLLRTASKRCVQLFSPSTVESASTSLISARRLAAIPRQCASTQAVIDAGYWRGLVADLQQRLQHDLARSAASGGPVRAANSALRRLVSGGNKQRTSPTEQPAMCAADFAQLRQLFESADANAAWGRLGNAWPGRLLEHAGRPLAKSLLDELEIQIGLSELAVTNPGLLADMSKAHLLLLADAPSSARCLNALKNLADPAALRLLSIKLRSLQRQLLDDARAVDLIASPVTDASSDSTADWFASREQLFAHFDATSRRRRENTASPLALRRPWDVDESLVAKIAAAPISWGGVRQLLVEPACRLGLLFSPTGALELARLLLRAEDAPSTTVEATADRRCPSCNRSLAESYGAASAASNSLDDDVGRLDAAGLAERLAELRLATGQPVWRTDPDEAADFRQWLRHKTTRTGRRPGAVLDLNNLLLLLPPGVDGRRSRPDFAEFFCGLDNQLPLGGRALRHLVFVGKLAESKRLFTDEFFQQFRQYCKRAAVPVSMYLFRRSACDDLFALYASLVNWPRCYMFSADQFREQRKHLTPLDRRTFQRWQATCQVGISQVSRDSTRSGVWPYRFTWPPGYPVRSVAHADGSVHLLCGASDNVADDLSFWPSFSWVCVPATATAAAT